MYTSFFKKLIKTWIKEIYMDIILVDLYLKKSVISKFEKGDERDDKPLSHAINLSYPIHWQNNYQNSP